MDSEIVQPKRRKAKNGAASKWIQANIGHTGDDCLKWPFSRGKAGYGNCYWEGRYRNAHRIICELAHGGPPTDKHHAAHSCGKGAEGCVNPKHLRWATPSDNNLDKRLHQTDMRGERNGLAKLTAAQVVTIRSLKGKATYKEIGRSFSIATQTVEAVMNRKIWTHI